MVRGGPVEALDFGGSLRAPSTVQFAGVPFTGEINVSAGDDVSTISLSLAAESSEIGDLAELLMDAKGVDGRFDKARLDFSSKGKTLRELVQSSELDFALESASMTYGNESGSRPVEFVLAGAGHIAGVINPVTMNKYFFLH